MHADMGAPARQIREENTAKYGRLLKMSIRMFVYTYKIWGKIAKKLLRFSSGKLDEDPR